MAIAPKPTVKLSDVLRAECEAVEFLTQQLRCEYELLKMRDAEGLEALTRQKRDSVLHLQAQITARTTYLQSRKCAPDLHGLLALIATAPPEEQPELTALATALAEATWQARAQNDINGTVISASRGHVEQALAILSGRDPLDCLYDHETRKVFSGSSLPIAKA